ncbi:MAG TPA: TaqI family restriction endonuclease [Chitinophagaceae bacterium]|nr:TaqI family restriction endonuclease [Chitinophagaceae bacterium]
MPETLIQQYESFLSSLTLYPALSKMKTLEMDLKGELNPSFHLDKLFFKENKWLSFDQFYYYYFDQYKDVIKKEFNYKDHTSFENGLWARLYRTQFGFLTEYHAFHLCSEFFGKERLNRSVELDKAGVDFQLTYKDQIFNMHIFVDTPRAWSFRLYKTINKNVNNLQGIHVNLPYSLKENNFNSLRYLKNKFGVYTIFYLQYLKQQIEMGRIKNNNITGTTSEGFIYMD